MLRAVSPYQSLRKIVPPLVASARLTVAAAVSVRSPFTGLRAPPFRIRGLVVFAFAAKLPPALTVTDVAPVALSDASMTPPLMTVVPRKPALALAIRSVPTPVFVSTEPAGAVSELAALRISICPAGVSNVPPRAPRVKLCWLRALASAGKRAVPV
jgi:hypothetical protein